MNLTRLERNGVNMTRLATRLLLLFALLFGATRAALQCTLPSFAQGKVAAISIVTATSNSGEMVPMSITMTSDEGGATYVAGSLFSIGVVTSSTFNFLGNCGSIQVASPFNSGQTQVGFLAKYACNATCLWVRSFFETGSWNTAPAPGQLALKSVRVGRDGGVYVAGDMGCLPARQNVTFANLTWIPPHPETCDGLTIAFLLKFNHDATAVLWYYFTDIPQGLGGACEACVALTVSMRLDGNDNVYWMIMSETLAGFYLLPNSTSNYTRVSTTWGVTSYPYDCVVVKAAGADGRIQWWNVFGAAYPGAKNCIDMDVSLDGTKGVLLHTTRPDGGDVLYPCGVVSPVSNSANVMRLTSFDTRNGSCVKTTGFGNSGSGFYFYAIHSTFITFAPQSSDAFYVHAETSAGTGCTIIPPLPAVKCMTGTLNVLVAKLDSSNHAGIWATSFSSISNPADSLAYIQPASLAADGNHGLVVTGYTYHSSFICFNANVYCNASNGAVSWTLPPADFPYQAYVMKLSTADGSLKWSSVYLNGIDTDAGYGLLQVSAYGREGYGLWATSLPGFLTNNDTATYGDTAPFYGNSPDYMYDMPVVFHADNVNGVSATMAQACDTCMHLYNTDSPTCDPITYYGNVTWASVASGTNMDTDIIDIESSFIHTDGTVWVAGRINTSPTGNLDFGGDCGIVGVGPFGNPFTATYDNCTGRCKAVNIIYSQTTGVATDIQLGREGQVFIGGNVDCLAGGELCPGANSPFTCVLTIEGGCPNTTSNRYTAWISGLTPDANTAYWLKYVGNSETSVFTRGVQIDNVYPIQTVYWMTQMASGPGTSGHGIITANPDGRNPGGNGWASGEPVDCVLWAINSATGALGNVASYGDGDSSHLKQCQSMSVTADGTRVAIVMTTSGAAVTLEPCGIDYAGGRGVDTRVVYINAATFACITTTVFSSGGAFADVPWGISFGLYGSLFVVGETDHADPGTGITFPPLQPVTQGHGRDGWVARLQYSAAANNLSGAWAHSIASDGADTCLTVDTDGHYGVGVAGIYTSTNLCLDPVSPGFCNSGNSFAGTAVNNTQVYVIKFDAVSGAKLWNRVYATNTTSPTTTRALSISAYGVVGYGFWAVTGSGRQIQQSQYTFGGNEVVYTPATSNVTFGFVTKELDTVFGFSNTSVTDGCASAPCQHGATCSVTFTDASTPICTCVAGYSGTFCQTDVNECASSPCTNGATCVDAVNNYYCTYCLSSPCQNGGTCVTLTPLPDFTCTCAAGYSGPVCQTSIDECASTPCQNGGTCTDALNRYSCACAVGYSGPICQTNIDDCASSPCQNGGTCVDAANRYSCICPAGRSGPLCQTDVNECASTPCQNAGTCTDALNRYTCTCAVGYSGPVCQSDINECASSPCQNGGTCTDALNRYSCACAPGYSGQICQTDVNECASTPCQNGATCTDAANRFSCVCAAGYSGPSCQTDVNECASTPCQNAGTCTDATNRYTCTCAPGYSGPVCQTDIDECVSSPCQNGATCSNSVNRYTCTCASGFNGVQCQTNINECASNPCINSGTCVDGANGFACTCLQGYSGKLCQTIVDVCASAPCRNGGSCEGAVGGYSCHCSPGYSGPQCQTDINECASTPCLNAGTCVDGTNAYGCTCAPGYSGAQCQTNIDECASSPCLNGGSCVDATNRYTCSCSGGYSGVLCQTNIDECASSPCQNSGTCTDVTNAYVCTCASGYSGGKCQTNINECASTPCYNGGTCADATNRYSCACAPGFSGSFCQTNINECVSSPCRNGATCYDEVNFFFCACASGYTGALCQSDINECATSNGGCDTHSNCTNTVGSRTCSACPVGYTGTGDATCFLLTDPCGSTPCQNGGTCVPSGSSDFTCTCPAQFTGDLCQTDVNECAAVNGGCDTLTNCTNLVGSYGCGPCPFGYAGTGLTGCTNVDSACASIPCQNGGTCNSYALNVTYNCTCPAGFLGAHCQTDINECATLSGGCDSLTLCVNTPGSRLCSACPPFYTGTGATGCVQTACGSQPCQNGGTCSGTSLTSYACACTTGYTGTQCQTYLACISSPCQNSGTCTSASGSFSCVCVSGYSGVRCQTQINECASTPCRNGATCTDAVNSYSCTCAPGYSGRTCQVDINECASSPCFNGGTCTDGVNRFTCACDSASATGAFCQTGLSGCESQPCQNAGVCAVTDSGANYTCACQPGYSGHMCQTDIDECVSMPCQNGGNCTDLINSFSCNCTGTPGNGTLCQHSDCDSSPCRNGARCTARLASVGNNNTFTCTCASSYYIGTLCEAFNSAVPLEVRRSDVLRAVGVTLAVYLGILSLASVGVAMWYYFT